MKNISRHLEWLSLIEVSGPFLSIPVLEKAFPQGLDVLESYKRKKVRSAYEEWVESIENEDPDLLELHQEWIKLILTEVLEYDEEVLVLNSQVEEPYNVVHSDGFRSFSPDYVIKGDNNEKPRMFISIQAPNTDLLSVENKDSWHLSIMDRMTMLCRDTEVSLGLVTNGEQWMLVHRPTGEVSGYVIWLSRIWFQELSTLKAFQSLLGIRRCFGPEEERLETLLTDSIENQEDVTETLGEQVRRAVEVLVQSLDKADEDRNRELLHGVSPEELYEAGLTVMMRLVFLLCAEERGLLLLGDPVYDQFYAVSNLRSQLAEESDQHGPEILERRYDAWARLLTLFRAVYGGVEYESLRLPALGGTLFDPDRYPFLEGREKGSNWLEDLASPLPIDNRTVLLLLTSLQVLEQRGGAVFLSYKGLDVEQIGHVYEGLLEFTVVRVPEVTLGLLGSHKVLNPNFPLSQLEEYKKQGGENLINLLKNATGRSESAIRNAFSSEISDDNFSNLLRACGGDIELAERIKPYMKLLRTDAWGSLIIYRDKSFIVALGADRRETGTHYTPKSLTESVVSTTLEPLVYHGPSEGKNPKEWVLKSSAELLGLKICDLAMGSGAFLVQACRWLAQRLVEAWYKEENEGKFISIDGKTHEFYERELMPSHADDRLLIARRIVAEKCLYGVDLNPMAVELAKLSIWLVTLSKGRPFGFFDHNFRHGDSLLGISQIEQLKKLNLHFEKNNQQIRIFGEHIEKKVAEILDLRKSMNDISIIDIQDVKVKARIDQKAREEMKHIELVADAMISQMLQFSDNTRLLDAALDTLSSEAWELINGDSKVAESIEKRTYEILTNASKNQKSLRKPFHWPLEFPEVFTNDGGGFNAIIGNPPFMGGRRMRGSLGDSMLEWLSLAWPHASMNADLCSFFYLRAVSLLSNKGEFGLLATKTIGQGDTARTGLSYIVEKEHISIRYALSSFPWPGKASVTAALVVGHKGEWKGVNTLDGSEVKSISPALDDQEEWGKAQVLQSNKGKSYQGSVVAGIGFVLSKEEAFSYLQQRTENKEVVLPYLSGSDINSHPTQKASRYVIDFRNISLEKCEENWPELLARVRQLVKPDRDKVRRKAHRMYWWHHGDKRPALYEQIKSKKEIFVVSRVTKYVMITKVLSKQVFSDAVVVLDLPSWSSFATLQCSFHELWVRQESSSMKKDIRYTPSDSFDTYPFLQIKNTKLDEIGIKYHQLRKSLMEQQNEGLTMVYNRFHDPQDKSVDIQKLRKLHEEMDKAVAEAYGWLDITLDHNFYETKHGVRFTISEKARVDVLKRLLQLNHEIYEKETSLKSVKKKGKHKDKIQDPQPKDIEQLTLFKIDKK